MAEKDYSIKPRCRGTYGHLYRPEEKRGQQCEAYGLPQFDGFCSAHRPSWGDRQCIAHYYMTHPTKPGQRCVEPSMRGQKVCAKHGGKTPQAKEKAKIRLAEEAVERRVKRLLAKQDAAPVANPLEALSLLAGEVMGFKESLAEMVNNLNSVRYESGSGEQLRAEVALYERSLDRCASILGGIAKLNIDERLARIEEAKVTAIVRAIDVSLNNAGITGDKAISIKKDVARRLRAV